MTVDRTPPVGPVVPSLAAAVVGLRDTPHGLEVLVGQRTTAARFMGGVWVFPGGQVDPVDGTGELGFRRAAARELAEEVGVVVSTEQLVPFDRWITPEALPRRFDTFFFLVRLDPDATIVVDGEEIVASRWATPAQLLEDARARRTAISFPTLRQLEKLASWPTAADALAACGGSFPPPITPVLPAGRGPVVP